MCSAWFGLPDSGAGFSEVAAFTSTSAYASASSARLNPSPYACTTTTPRHRLYLFIVIRPCTPARLLPAASPAPPHLNAGRLRARAAYDYRHHLHIISSALSDVVHLLAYNPDIISTLSGAVHPHAGCTDLFVKVVDLSPASPAADNSQVCPQIQCRSATVV